MFCSVRRTSTTTTTKTNTQKTMLRRRRREQDQHADHGHYSGGDREGRFHWFRIAGDIFQVL